MAVAEFESVEGFIEKKFEDVRNDGIFLGVKSQEDVIVFDHGSEHKSGFKKILAALTVGKKAAPEAKSYMTLYYRTSYLIVSEHNVKLEPVTSPGKPPDIAQFCMKKAKPDAKMNCSEQGKLYNKGTNSCLVLNKRTTALETINLNALSGLTKEDYIILMCLYTTTHAVIEGTGDFKADVAMYFPSNEYYYYIKPDGSDLRVESVPVSSSTDDLSRQRLWFSTEYNSSSGSNN